MLTFSHKPAIIISAITLAVVVIFLFYQPGGNKLTPLQIRVLVAERQLQGFARMVSKYEQVYGKAPKSWKDIVAMNANLPGEIDYSRFHISQDSHGRAIIYEILSDDSNGIALVCFDDLTIKRLRPQELAQVLSLCE